MDLRSVVKKTIEKAGYELTPRAFSTSTDNVLDRCLRLAGPIGTVIDVGASDGRWSREMMGRLPNAKYLLVEAQDVHRQPLEAFRAQTGAEYVVAAASDHTGSLHFLDNGDLSGSASTETFGENDIEVPCVAIDEVVTERTLPGPYLLKLDTHGHEVQILDGASKVLTDAALVIIETYSFANFGRLMFDEMCQHMRSLGFRPAGIADLMTRRDGLLWQSDIVFLSAGNPAFNDTTYTAAANLV